MDSFGGEVEMYWVIEFGYATLEFVAGNLIMSLYEMATGEGEIMEDVIEVG